MAKKISGFIKLEIPAGQANPSPPVGPALGARGLNIMEFCKAFNAATQSGSSLSAPLQGALYMIAAAFLFAMMNGAIRLLGDGAASGERRARHLLT